jgi:hypothetical protein
VFLVSAYGHVLYAPAFKRTFQGRYILISLELDGLAAALFLLLLFK